MSKSDMVQTLSIFVESRYGWSALGMGLIFLPMAIPAFFEPCFGALQHLATSPSMDIAHLSQALSRTESGPAS